MFERLKIRTRLLVALGLMAALVILVGASGSLGVLHVERTTQEILLRDAHLAEEALQARASTLQLRRYEKDYFLNIGAPDKQAEYLVKWNAAHVDLLARLNELNRLVTSDADHEILRGMREDLGVYEVGFEKVSGAVRSGELATPQAANIAITHYKDAIRRLDMTAGALGGTGDRRMRERLKMLAADSTSTNSQVGLTVALAVAIAILMSLHLARSISAPVQGMLSAARRIAAGDLTKPVTVTAQNELGELQQALLTISERLNVINAANEHRTH